MKALTICQPYAHLIAIGEKRVENRTWPTSYRGPLAIHAGKNTTWLQGNDKRRYPDMVFGAVVAVADLVACFRVRDVFTFVRENPDFAWLTDHEHTEGPWCWVLDSVQRLPVPLAMKGAQGLFDVSEGDFHMIDRRLPRGIA